MVDERVYTATETWEVPAVPLQPSTKVRCDECGWSGRLDAAALDKGEHFTVRRCPTCGKSVFRTVNEDGGEV